MMANYHRTVEGISAHPNQTESTPVAARLPVRRRAALTLILLSLQGTHAVVTCRLVLVSEELAGAMIAVVASHAYLFFSFKHAL